MAVVDCSLWRGGGQLVQGGILVGLYEDDSIAVGVAHSVRPSFFFSDSGISGGGGAGQVEVYLHRVIDEPLQGRQEDSTVNTSEPPNTTPAPTNSTPVAPKYMEQMRETPALLEQDFIEFRELTMARLCEHSLSQQLRDEVCQVKRECRMALSEAMAELKELQEDNGALRAQLASFKEDMKLLEPS
ncbi:hypothetical protein SKAU_G00277120 [Synaphobranchus kaupii]|uniref:Uncharacterized protein n=1 Tax=Synaphobranchus kaupii TaxID=118154 RepID=A0A9Q1IP57_SYNKA|nr:hypothetical protein SKAU_G00277120 [Synaphobranchus kaupii]